jgi:hypothetical protein
LDVIMPATLRLDEIVEAADQLSREDQEQLIAILHHRLVQSARRRIAADVQEARREFAAGRCLPISAGDLMRQLPECP